MRVLNICSHDWANFAHDNANALRSVGVDCIDLKSKPHKFSYKPQSGIIRREDVRKIAKDVDVVQVFHSDINMANAIKDYAKKIIVYHTGSGYRSEPDKYNKAFNPFVDMSVIALPEFAGLGSKNERYLVGAFNVPEMPKVRLTDKPVFGHYPSHEIVKGSNEILDMVFGEYVNGEVDLRWSFDKANHLDHIKRMKGCDIIIELFKPILEGEPYGSFGITALEAASMGKIVVTQCLRDEVYKSVYGNCELMLGNTRGLFVSIINELLGMSAKQIRDKRVSTYEWVRDNHSCKATGERLKTMLHEL